MQTDDLDDPELIKETPSAAEHKFVFSSYERVSFEIDINESSYSQHYSDLQMKI